ncbi:PREDICTED: uncharacterized protein LOC104789688 [Camelina sativa]|uniref:Uncharacterized protein LOC104789688 n=1 Tax=Camelina sativa TaxID=90675 RepID=A0ABM1RPL3_CAMSA|nr:PREDICTED: uncharacterized protein LOC104789688 [Camelina sativa]
MEPPKSDILCDRLVTGNSEIDNWIWIIEYFAKFKSELWMLHDVFEMGPKLPDNLGEHTNEMVAFRCLASLFDSSTPEQSKDDADSKVEFDLSQSCEYVLQCILDEIPLSELKPGAPGLSKWNLLPFIKSKLLCLPKCTLELMLEPSSCEKDTEVSPCNEEETLRNGRKRLNELLLQWLNQILWGKQKADNRFVETLEMGLTRLVDPMCCTKEETRNFKTKAMVICQVLLRKYTDAYNAKKVGCCGFVLKMAAKLWLRS